MNRDKITHSKSIFNSIIIIDSNKYNEKLMNLEITSFNCSILLCNNNIWVPILSTIIKFLSSRKIPDQTLCFYARADTEGALMAITVFSDLYAIKVIILGFKT